MVRGPWSHGPGTSGGPSADRCAPVVVSMLLLRSCLYQISVRSVTAPPFRMLARVLSCLCVRVRVLLAHLLCADGLARAVLAGVWRRSGLTCITSAGACVYDSSRGPGLSSVDANPASAPPADAPSQLLNAVSACRWRSSRARALPLSRWCGL